MARTKRLIPAGYPDDMPPIGELREALREVGAALCRARNVDPNAFRHGLPAWFGVLPVPLAQLASSEEVWEIVARHEGVEREDLDADLFEPMTRG